MGRACPRGRDRCVRPTLVLIRVRLSAHADYVVREVAGVLQHRAVHRRTRRSAERQVGALSRAPPWWRIEGLAEARPAELVLDAARL